MVLHMYTESFIATLYYCPHSKLSPRESYQRNDGNEYGVGDITTNTFPETFFSKCTAVWTPTIAYDTSKCRYFNTEYDLLFGFLIP